eukprot:1965625-Amphidinium_carterae.1
MATAGKRAKLLQSAERMEWFSSYRSFVGEFSDQRVCIHSSRLHKILDWLDYDCKQTHPSTNYHL